MPTKAGQLKLSDIKQGKQGWLVNVRCRPGEVPRVTSLELVRFRCRPYLKKIHFEFERDQAPIVAFDPLQRQILRGHHITMSAMVYGLYPSTNFNGIPKEQKKYYSRFFNTKKAAIRYWKRFYQPPKTPFLFKVVTP